MPKGPRGEKRAADLIGMSVVVGQIATDEIENNKKSVGVRSGIAGDQARAAKRTSVERSEMVRGLANARWY